MTTRGRSAPNPRASVARSRSAVRTPATPAPQPKSGAKVELTPEVLDLVAARFKVLAEPARLNILAMLREGERTVTELMDESGLGQANLSKHLQILHAHGFVTRRKEGLYVFYSLADRDVFTLCDIMCGRLGAEASMRQRTLGGTSH